jgi:hypothetical protein
MGSDPPVSLSVSVVSVSSVDVEGSVSLASLSVPVEVNSEVPDCVDVLLPSSDDVSLLAVVGVLVAPTSLVPEASVHPPKNTTHAVINVGGCRPGSKTTSHPNTETPRPAPP